jgi:hypothetical protein
MSYNVLRKHTSHYSIKDLSDKKHFIHSSQYARSRERARKLGSPVLPKNKLDLKDLIDQQLTIFYNN